MNNSKLNIKNSTLFYAHFISEDMSQKERVEKLNKVAITQMNILLSDKSMKKLEGKK